MAKRIFTGFSTVEARGITDTKLYDLDLIKRDLFNHFSIKRGEKLENPNFGTVIPWLVFEPFTNDIARAVEDDVIRIFSYDPRVQLEAVGVTRDDERQTLSVQCRVSFVTFNAVDDISWEFLEDGTIRMK
jgi:phage baseplate assembly protein W